MRTLISLLAFSLFFSNCKTPPAQHFDLLISNVHIVDVANGKLIENQLVGIKDGRIVLTAPADSLKPNQLSFDQHKEGHGQFLMPALWDMHVHFRGGDSLIQENKNLLAHFISHGITTVRDAGGDLTTSVLEWRSAYEQSESVLPRIFTSGPKLDGAEPAWPGSIPVVSLNDVQWALDSLEQLGVDFVKVYDGSMSKDIHYAIIAEAEKRGLKITGHMPMDAFFMKAVELGLDGTEHMHYLTKSCSPLEDSLTELGLGYRMLPHIAESFDHELADARYELLAEKGVFVTPTLYISKTLSELATADHSNDSMLQHMEAGIISSYAMRIENAKRSLAKGNNRRSRMLELSMEMVPKMHAKDVRLLAGSDCGTFNSYVYPGDALWQELYLLVEAGLKPHEALTTSIINGPAFFELSADYGSVEKGKVAELILLEANPLENIHAIESLTWLYTRAQGLKLPLKD
jgi:imidazolonepropionase-like amidohydrolase